MAVNKKSDKLIIIALIFLLMLIVAFTIIYFFVGESPLQNNQQYVVKSQNSQNQIIVSQQEAQNNGNTQNSAITQNQDTTIGTETSEVGTVIIQSSGSSSGNSNRNTQTDTQTESPTNTGTTQTITQQNECISGLQLTEQCNAQNSCPGTKTKICVDGIWTYSSCQTNLQNCQGTCKTSCDTTATMQSLMNKYNINEQTLVFYYGNEVHSQNMIPFMSKMSNTLLLQDGKDKEMEQFLGLTGTIPTSICFSTKASLIGEKTQSEVEYFKDKNC